MKKRGKEVDEKILKTTNPPSQYVEAELIKKIRP